MEELTNESILENEVDVRHRAYMMTEKKMVIKKPITQCNIGMLELICDSTFPVPKFKMTRFNTCNSSKFQQ
jgi:hypothetical protein